MQSAKRQINVSFFISIHITAAQHKQPDLLLDCDLQCFFPLHRKHMSSSLNTILQNQTSYISTVGILGITFSPVHVFFFFFFAGSCGLISQGLQERSLWVQLWRPPKAVSLSWEQADKCQGAYLVCCFKDSNSNHTDRNLTLKGRAKRERRSYTDEKKVKLVVGNYVREKQKRDIRGHFLPILIEETFLGGP